MKSSAKRKARRKTLRRRGAASIDYILILAVILPLVAWMMTAGRRILQLAYEMVCLLVAWPFM